jgi:hypothetical protein
MHGPMNVKFALVLVLLFAVCLDFVWKAIISQFEKYVKKTHLNKTQRWYFTNLKGLRYL